MGIAIEDVAWGVNEISEAHGAQRFTANGTFVVPDNVYKILVTACGGGGGGTRYGNSGESGNGGGGADYCIKEPFSVTPQTSISITIGKGGTPASNGGNTVVGTLITLEGGKSNGKGAGKGGYGGFQGSSSSSGSVPSILTINGQNSGNAPGGRGTIGTYSGSNPAYCHGAGGGSLGHGADAGYSVPNVSSVQAGSPGYGGGGAGGYSISGYSQATSGGQGVVIIEW